MALKTFVKVSKVNNLSDARYCAGMGVNIIGFNVEPGRPHYISANEFVEITGWLSGVEYVAEYETFNEEQIKQSIADYPVEFIQIANPALIDGLTALGKQLILKFEAENLPDKDALEEILSTYNGKVSFFLFESEKDAQFALELELVLSFANEYPIVIGFGFDENNVSDLADKYPVKGISLIGEEEIRAGYKDFEKLADVLEVLEVEEY